MTLLPWGWFSFSPKSHSWKTRRQCRHVFAIFQACCAIVLPVNTEVLFFAFCCEIWHKRWMNRHPEKLRGGQTCFLMVFRAVLRLSNYFFCSIFSREFCLSYFSCFFQLCKEHFNFSAEIVRKESRVYLALMSVSSMSYDLSFNEVSTLSQSH